mgnify:CR=1 FL=1
MDSESKMKIAEVMAKYLMDISPFIFVLYSSYFSQKVALDRSDRQINTINKRKLSLAAF